ncbi:helix-turn-helix transcriptional regulator [Rhizobium sp. Leaf321]|uniref:helix-turn-helix domain-containing protein n=1 Tax=Rhizobium sp. Leaf321 TaxID=1736335 RepID=UPI000A95FD61|nr:helix-turn-helix transcriptional regulator [Rhizobium sp. Leaf321]
MAHQKGIELVDVEVGARIRERRKFLGLSQTNLAERIGVTFQQVQKYEKGANRVGSSRLHQIASVLRVEPAALFGQFVEGQEVGSQEVAALAQMMGSSEGLAFNRAFAKISDVATRRSILALVKVIASSSEPTES